MKLSEPETGFNHASATGEAERTSGSFEFGEAANYGADGRTVDVSEAGKIEDDAIVFLCNQVFDFVFQTAAIGTGVDAAAPGEDGNAVTEMAFGQFENHCENPPWRAGERRRNRDAKKNSEIGKQDGSRQALSGV